MANVKTEYTSIGTMTLTAPGSGNARESTAVDNTSGKYIDVLIRQKFVAGTVSGNKQVVIYATGSEDGTNYESIATGSDAAITLRSPESLAVAKVIPVPTSSVTYQVTYSLAQCWGGVLPRKFNVVFVDDTAGGVSALTSEATGVYYTVV
jgi:hypothetical protein